MPDDQREISPTPHLTSPPPAAPNQSFHFLLATISPLHPSNPKHLVLRHELAFIYMRGSVVPPLTPYAGTGALFLRDQSPCFPQGPHMGPGMG